MYQCSNCRSLLTYRSQSCPHCHAVFAGDKTVDRLDITKNQRIYGQNTFGKMFVFFIVVGFIFLVIASLIVNFWWIAKWILLAFTLLVAWIVGLAIKEIYFTPPR